MDSKESNDIKIQKLVDFILYHEDISYDGNHQEMIAFRFFIVGFTLSKILTKDKEENFNIFITVSEKLKKQFANDPSTYHLLNNRMSEYNKVLQETTNMNEVSEIVGMKYQQYANVSESRWKSREKALFRLYSKRVISIYNDSEEKMDQASLITKLNILVTSACFVGILYWLGIPKYFQSDHTDNRVSPNTPPNVSQSNSTDNNTIQSSDSSVMQEDELQKAELQTIHQFAQAYNNDQDAVIKLIDQNPNCSGALLQIGTTIGESWLNVLPKNKIYLVQVATHAWECLGNKTTTLTMDEVISYMDNLLIQYPNDKIFNLWSLFHAVFQFDMDANKE